MSFVPDPNFDRSLELEGIGSLEISTECLPVADDEVCADVGAKAGQQAVPESGEVAKTESNRTFSVPRSLFEHAMATLCEQVAKGVHTSLRRNLYGAKHRECLLCGKD